MTKFTYLVELKNNETITSVTKLSTGEVKTFYNSGDHVYGLTKLMESITDDQAESYFPKERINAKANTRTAS